MSKRMQSTMRISAFAVVSCVFIALFAKISSPLNDYHGIDCGIFRTMGEYWLNQGVIYRDLFDSKGPYLFLIQVIGEMISHGKWGIYILECISLTFSLEMLYRIGHALGAKKLRVYVSLLMFLAFFALTIEWGNTVEEWSLPFVILPLLLYVKHQAKHDADMPAKYCIILGICFGIVALMRINNDAIIVGIVLGVSYGYIKRKAYLALLKAGGYALMGIAIAAAPMVIYFWYHGALDEMLYATFTYNMKYREVWDTVSSFRLVVNALRMTLCLLLIIASWYYDRQRHCHTLPVMLSISVVSFFTFYNGASYLHYFAMVAPLIFLLSVISMDLRWWCQTLMCALIVVPLIRDWDIQRRIAAIFLLNDNWTVNMSPSGSELLNERYHFIPEEERSSIYLLDVGYFYIDMLHQCGYRPVGKYFIAQDYVKDVDEKVKEDIIYSFEQAQPKWVISCAPIEETLLHDQIPYYVMRDSCASTRGVYNKIYLYQRK